MLDLITKQRLEFNHIVLLPLRRAQARLSTLFPDLVFTVSFIEIDDAQLLP